MDKKEILTNASKGLQKKQSFIARVWNRIKAANKLVFFNIILLGLVITMLAVMLDSIKKQDTYQKQAKQTAEIQNSRPTVVIARNVTLPLRRALILPERVIIRQIVGNVIIDGKNLNTRMREMTTINGNLYLQNLQTYTLPCGTKINGNLYLRNVKMLKFCGCFKVAGDIYVSRESSFGPIPKNAILGGQVIF
jgi:hypothetical protein